MTPQEHDLLKGLTDRVNQTQLTDKDPEAEQFIFQNLGKNSDSLYIMAQTILVQQYALDNAKKQLDDLNQQLTERNQQLEQLQQQQAQQPVKHTSFLGSLLGNDQPAPPPPLPPQQYGQAQYQPVPNAPPPNYGQAYGQPVQYAQPVTYAQPAAYGAPAMGGMMGGGMMGGGGSSFLRSAATTAAGVAAGAIAFEGIESLMHGFENHAGYGGGYGGGGGFNSGPREEIINNYYGDSDRGSEHHDQGRDLTDRFADAGDHPSQDIEDRRDDTRSFAGNDIPADDTTQFDSSADNFADDSSSDNSGGFDDGGGGFDGGGSDDSNS